MIDKGRGVMCLYKNELKVEKIKPPFPINSMEFMAVMLTVWSKKVCLITIYHPEASQENKYTMGDFYKEFSKLMSHYNIVKDELLVDENAFKRQKNRVNALLNAFSIKYNSDLVKNNPKSLFRIIN